MFGVLFLMNKITQWQYAGSDPTTSTLEEGKGWGVAHGQSHQKILGFRAFEELKGSIIIIILSLSLSVVNNVDC